MRSVNVTYKIYEFSELSEDVKAKVKEWYLNNFYSPTLFFYLILSSIILFMYESAIDERRIIFVLYEFITINVRRNKKNVGEK